MYSVKVFNTLSEKGLSLFPQDKYSFSHDINDSQAILLRSEDLHQHNIPGNVLAVGRSGAGTNNIPVASLTDRGVPVINTPGANANAVKELVITGMLLACRHIFSAWQYVCELNGSVEEQHQSVEKDKKQFVGMELPGKTLAVIGLGNIGVEVANSARQLGMHVIGYDPQISVKNAWKLRSSIEQADSLYEAIDDADFISLHVPLLPSTQGMVDDSFFSRIKSSAVLLNFARSDLVVQASLVNALEQQALRNYVCDFPLPNLKRDPRVICLPHLGASTVEAQENCAVMVVNQMRSFLERGHIEHSVNFPTVKMSRGSDYRLTVVNRNIPNMVAQLSTVLSNHGMNIIEMINKSRDNIAYNIIDIDKHFSSSALEELRAIEGIIRVREIEPV